MISKKYFKLSYDEGTGILTIDTNSFNFDRNLQGVEKFPENNRCIYYIYDHDWSKPVPYRYCVGEEVFLRKTKGSAVDNVIAVANIGGMSYYAMAIVRPADPAPGDNLFHTSPMIITDIPFLMPVLDMTYENPDNNQVYTNPFTSSTGDR